MRENEQAASERASTEVSYPRFQKENDRLQKEPESCGRFNPFKDNPKLLNSASRKIKKAIQAAISEGASQDELDLISYRTGFPIHLARIGFIRAQNYDFIKKYPNESVPIFGNQYWLEKVNRHSLELTLGIESIDKKTVIDKLSTGLLKSDSIFIYDGTKSTLLRFLYTKSSWFSHDTIIDLLEAGYTPNLSDLAFLTSIKVDQAILEKLWHRVEGDVSSIHKFPPFYQSLSSIALFYGNFDALEFWLDHGSPINPDPFYASALSALEYAQKRGLFTSLEEAFIVKEIVKTKLTENDILTISKTYKDQLTTSDLGSLSSNLIDSYLQSDVVIKSVQKIQNIVLEPLNAKFENSDCIDKYVVGSVAFILKKHLEEYKNKALSKTEALSLPNSVQIALAELAKKKVEKEKMQTEELIRKSEEIQEKIENELSDEDILTIEDVYAAAQKGDWSLALALLESLDSINSDALDTLVSFAISTTSEPEPLIELINLGGELNKASYLQIIVSNRTKHVEALLPHGLNIKESLLPDSDVIKDVVKYGTPEMLTVFLKHGVYIDFSIDGMDALDILLERFSLKGPDVEFLQEIMKTPVEIEPSHKAFVYELYKSSPFEFQYISERYPELVSFKELDQML